VPFRIIDPVGDHVRRTADPGHSATTNHELTTADGSVILGISQLAFGSSGSQGGDGSIAIGDETGEVRADRQDLNALG